ncbi:adenosylcobinamide-phosphate synthase CbiB [Roseobacter sp. YSTF-M11]|uniref:Cobalamin biosynthesis protein CobD n=1 Tax=Roseobacter insulae TaxID=2859783 RepID=A0A9X1FX46_9RHOB|nr:adenosylcobinamide-phosphate synthase CbiB [Roseobacter insulae]MBW4709263.1 adenosylcobinamide-phosphate synthase CbiB [Roseobacter insulae]
MSAAALLIVAMLLDAVVGEPRWLWRRIPHPAVLMGRLVHLLDARLNDGDNRHARGVAAVLVLVIVGAVLGSVLSGLGSVIECGVAAILLAQRSLVQHVNAVGDGLRMSIQEGRRMVSRIVSRDVAQMDGTQVARSAIESAAENLSDGVIAPAFWFLVAGLPGLMVYKLVNTADSMIGYRTETYAAFGWAAARLDDLLNLVPARLTAALIALPARCFDWQGIYADARLHRSPNAGWPEAAMSRALGIALAGPRAYDGQMREFPFVNAEGRRDLTPVDIDASIAMLWKAWAGFLALCVLIVVL